MFGKSGGTLLMWVQFKARILAFKVLLIFQLNLNGFCFNMAHFEALGATETEMMPKHLGRKPYGRNNGRYDGRKTYGRTLM